MRFFFYGTLLAGRDNPFAAAAHAVLRPLGPATVRGRLYALPDPQGWYPALLPGEGTTQGALYESTEHFGEADLARIDAYEDYHPENPAASLYVREILPASMADGASHKAQAYFFNQPLPPGSMPIAGGDFAAWLAISGFRALGEG